MVFISILQNQIQSTELRSATDQYHDTTFRLLPATTPLLFLFLHCIILAIPFEISRLCFSSGLLIFFCFVGALING
jgi:hypothetical protein